MYKKILKVFIISIFLGFLVTPVIAQIDPLGIKIVDTEVALSNEDPRTITIRLINVVLSLLGIITLIIILFGGFKWMTAGGNQEQIGQAKKILIAGLIGLVIVLLSWGITVFIIDQIGEATIIQY